MAADALINIALDHDGCIDGEYHAAQFVKSYLNYDARVNIKDLLVYIVLATVKEILDMTATDTLLEVVKNINPKLLEE